MNDIEAFIDLWSLRPQPGTPEGIAWERGARQGWDWAQLRIKQLEAERLVIKWKDYQHHMALYVGIFCIGCIFEEISTRTWYWDQASNTERFFSSKSAKAYVEEMLRAIS
jgi:hypothetical protein